MNLLKLKFLSVIFAVIIVCFSILSLYNNKNIWLSVFLLVAYIICNGTLPKAHLKLRYRIVFFIISVIAMVAMLNSSKLFSLNYSTQLVFTFCCMIPNMVIKTVLYRNHDCWWLELNFLKASAFRRWLIYCSIYSLYKW